MIRISKPPGGEALHTTLLVAFDPANGAIYGTFAHASLQQEDAIGLARSRETFLADIATHIEQRQAQVELLELPLHELPPGSIQRVDPKTRKLITRPHRPLSGATPNQR
jgi:hypothetical protein